MEIVIEEIFEKHHSSRLSYDILIDAKTIFSVSDGEPEDNSLWRGFSDCLKLIDILETVYKLGLKHVPVEFIRVNKDAILQGDEIDIH